MHGTPLLNKQMKKIRGLLLELKQGRESGFALPSLVREVLHQNPRARGNTSGEAPDHMVSEVSFNSNST